MTPEPSLCLGLSAEIFLKMTSAMTKLIFVIRWRNLIFFRFTFIYTAPSSHHMRRNCESRSVIMNYNINSDHHNYNNSVPINIHNNKNKTNEQKTNVYKQTLPTNNKTKDNRREDVRLNEPLCSCLICISLQYMVLEAVARHDTGTGLSSERIVIYIYLKRVPWRLIMVLYIYIA